MNASFKADETISTMHLEMSRRETPKLINALVKHYERLVHKQVHLLKTKTNEPYEDLFQVGCMGLIVALRRFDVARKVNDSCTSPRSVSFTSFAVPYIRGHILHYLRDKSSMVRVPRVWHEIYSKYRSVFQKDAVAGTRQMTTAHTVLNVTPEELEEIKLACENRTVTKELSFDIPDTLHSLTSASDQAVDRESVTSFLISSLSLKVNELDSDERSCIEKFYMQNMSVAKAARGSRVSPTNFKKMIQQTINKISECQKVELV